ncbi:MAG: O-antigen ligase family protein [Paracoccaceae bacterium]
MSVAEPMNRTPSRVEPTPDARAASGASRLPFLAMLYLIALMLPVKFYLGSLAISPARLLLMIIIIPMTLNLFSGKYGRVLPVDILFILHVAWAGVALGINNPGQFVENTGSILLEFIGGYLVGRAYIRSPQEFVGLIKALIFIVAATLPFAIAEALLDRSLILEWFRMTGLQTFDEVYHAPRMGLYRAQVNFTHPIHYGLFCSLVLSLTYVGLRTVVSSFSRYLFTGIVMVTVLLSLSSGALLAAGLQIGLILWDWVFRRMKRRWLLLVGFFVFMYLVIDILSNRSPIQVMMSYATFSSHNAWWRAIIFEWGMKNVWANPIFGLGLNEWVRPYYMYTSSMDNFWLVMAVRYGIPGFLLIVAGYIDALWRVGRRKFEPLTLVSNLRLAWMFVFMGLSFTLSTVHIWEVVYSFVFFMLGAGLWLTDYQVDESAKATDSPAAARPPAPVLSREMGMTLSRDHAEESAPAGDEDERRGAAAPYTRFHEEKTRDGRTPPKPRRRR